MADPRLRPRHAAVSSTISPLSQRATVQKFTSNGFPFRNLLATAADHRALHRPRELAIEHVQSPLAKSVLQGRLCSLSSGNVLNIILDVREWETTRDRQQLEPVFRRTVATDRGNWLIRAA